MGSQQLGPSWILRLVDFEPKKFTDGFSDVTPNGRILDWKFKPYQLVFDFITGEFMKYDEILQLIGPD